jgi:hypothetical protein
MRQRRWIAAAVGVALATTLIAPAAASAPSVAGTDKALLGAGVITGADVPSTWTQQTQADTAGKEYKGVKGCNRLLAAVLGIKRVPHAFSAVFRDPASLQSATYAADKVYAFKNAASAQKYVAVYQSSSAQACIQQLLTKQAGATTVVSIKSQLTGVGDANAGYEATLHASNQGQPVTLVADAIAVRVGRVVAGFAFLNVGNQAIPQGRGIVQAVIGRLSALPQ